MPNNIDSQYGAKEDLTITLNANVTDTNAQASASVDAATPLTPVAPQVEFFYSITTSGTPDDNSLIEFYFARSDGTIRDGGLAGSDALLGVDATPKSQLQFVHAQVVSNTAATYAGSFIVDNPGPSWQLVVTNETGEALAASPHDINYRYISPEVQ